MTWQTSFRNARYQIEFETTSTISTAVSGGGKRVKELIVTGG